MTVRDTLGRLRRVKKCRGGYTALCPAHDDRENSLSIGEGRGGCVLLHCHAGCELGQICAALGIEDRDLFPASERKVSRTARRVVKRYDYRGENSDLLFQVLRYEPKGFSQRRPDGAGGWLNDLDGVRRVPYCLPELLAAPAREPVLVVEGEKDVEAARSMGICATCNPGGAGKWRDEYSEFLRGKAVVIIADSDEPGRKHAQQVVVSLAGKAASIKPTEMPGAKDLSEYVERGGTREQLLAIIASAPEWTPPPSPNGAAIVRAIEKLLCDFVVLPLHTLLPVVLWIVGTYIFDVFDAFAFLLFLSPTPRCGKTRSLEVLELVVSNPRRTTNISEAALFRLADSKHPTFLIDEQEGLSEKSERAEALRGLLNAGHRRGAKATRCVGANRDEVREFDVFSPKVLAGIGDFPATIRDRAIVIAMQRRQPSQPVSRFVYRVVAQLTEPLRANIEAWVTANRDQVRSVYETAPPAEFLSDREEENWSPLFSVIAVADPSRMRDLREDAEALSKQKSESEDEQTLALEVLRHALEVWPENEDAISSAELIDRLQRKPDSPTYVPEKGRVEVEISQRRLARMLRGFGIRRTQSIRLDGQVRRGYRRSEISACLAPYLRLESATSATRQHNQQVSDDFSSATNNSVADRNSATSSTKERFVADVADKTPEERA